MHHDARVYIELRYDGDTCDCVVVHFRDRGILPIEVTTREYSLNSPWLGSDVTEELKTVINALWVAVYRDSL